MFLSRNCSRREFLIHGLLAGAGTAISYRLATAQPLGVYGANDRVRIGVIGLGNEGRRQIDILSSLPNVEVAMVCDRDDRRLGDSIRSLGSVVERIPESVTDPRGIFDRIDIDAVCLAVPLAQRSDLLRSAIESEKNVLVDRFYSRSSKEADEVIEQTRSSGRIVGLFDAGRSFLSGPRAARTLIGEEFVSVTGRFEESESGQPLRRANGRNRPRSLPKEVFSFLDIGREILGVAAPHHVNSFSGGVSGRTAFDFEFDGPDGEKTFMLETEVVPSGAQRTSSGTLIFESKRSSLEIYTQVPYHEASDQIVQSLFVEGIRGHQGATVEDLVNARHSIKMFELTTAAASRLADSEY